MVGISERTLQNSSWILYNRHFSKQVVNYSVFTKACCVLNGVKVFYLLTWTEHVSGNILTN